MYDSGTVRHCNIRITGHVICLFMLLFDQCICKMKQRLVFLILKICSLVFRKHLICSLFLCIILTAQLSKHLVRERLGKIIRISVRRLYFAVRLVRVDAKRQIRRQCPRRRRPRQKISVLSCHLKPYNRRALFYGLIPLRHFLRGKRRAAARAVRYGFKPFVQQLFIPDLL